MVRSIVDEILSGKVFIYPTDTIYGLGCDASNKESVNRIKKMKERDEDKPLSVIAPSFEWIEKNCKVDVDLNKYLPGGYTVVLKKRNAGFLDHVSKGNSLGVRIPDNEFSKMIQESGRPFITTSVNISGGKPITRISEIPKEIRDNVDVIVDEGKLSGKASTLVVNGKEVER